MSSFLSLLPSLPFWKPKTVCSNCRVILKNQKDKRFVKCKACNITTCQDCKMNYMEHDNVLCCNRVIFRWMIAAILIFIGLCLSGITAKIFDLMENDYFYWPVVVILVNLELLWLLMGLSHYSGDYDPPPSFFVAPYISIGLGIVLVYFCFKATVLIILVEAVFFGARELFKKNLLNY